MRKKPRHAQKGVPWTLRCGEQIRKCVTLERYQAFLREYKRILRWVKRNSWNTFCGNIETITEALRLRKTLTTTPTVPSELQRKDSFGMETLELLVYAHFLALGNWNTVSEEWTYKGIFLVYICKGSQLSGRRI